MAAEVYDMVKEDVARLYPPELVQYVDIQIVDLMDTVLSTYDRRLAEYATEHFRRANITLVLNSAVKSVGDGVITIADKASGVERCVPFGMCVWCAGVKMNPLCEKIMEGLPPGSQENVRSLTVDKRLRVKGSEGSIYALGDCATIERPNSLQHAERLFSRLGGEHRIGEEELVAALNRGAKEFPHLEELANRAGDEFRKLERGGTISFGDFQQLLANVDRQLRSLPATAQVAKQEGEYVAGVFNRAGGDAAQLAANDVPKFVYGHKGSLAYIGRDSAVMDIPGVGLLQGIAAGLIWKGFETYSQFSLRNKLLVAADWVRGKVFGRDISRIRF